MILVSSFNHSLVDYKQYFGLPIPLLLIFLQVRKLISYKKAKAQKKAKEKGIVAAVMDSVITKSKTNVKGQYMMTFYSYTIL